MARDRLVTPEEQAEEKSVQSALIADAGIIFSFFLIGFLGGSLTMMAETIRTSLMGLTELFSVLVMRRIHRGELADFEFGTGKLEQIASTVIGAAMLGGAVWIAGKALAQIVGERSIGTPFGLTMAAVAGALNLYVNFLAWNSMRRALRAESSLVMVAQLRARTVKLISSLCVLATMTLAALSTDTEVVAWADAVGSLFVATFIAVSALDLLGSGLTDLLDRSGGLLVRATIDRALARHAGDYGRVERVRSRRSGRVVFIELALRFDPGLTIAQVNQRIDALKQTLGREIEHSDISVLALAATE